MKYNGKKIVLFFIFIGVINGCTALVPNSFLRAAHKDMDSNNDGYIDYNEYLKSASNKDVAKEAKEKGMSIEKYQKWDFNRADANRDGKVTSQELIELFRR